MVESAQQRIDSPSFASRVCGANLRCSSDRNTSLRSIRLGNKWGTSNGNSDEISGKTTRLHISFKNTQKNESNIEMFNEAPTIQLHWNSTWKKSTPNQMPYINLFSHVCFHFTTQLSLDQVTMTHSPCNLKRLRCNSVFSTQEKCLSESRKWAPKIDRNGRNPNG